jgi:hypothetical protein
VLGLLPLLLLLLGLLLLLLLEMLVRHCCLVAAIRGWLLPL